MACSEYLRKKQKGEGTPAQHTYSLGYSDVYLLLIRTFSCRSIHIAYTESDVIFLRFNKYSLCRKKSFRWNAYGAMNFRMCFFLFFIFLFLECAVHCELNISLGLWLVGTYTRSKFSRQLLRWSRNSKYHPYQWDSFDYETCRRRKDKENRFMCSI